MNDNLDTLPDAQLNELFAAEVAEMEQRRGSAWWSYRGSHEAGALPPFCTDANAVLPWLEKHPIVECAHNLDSWWLVVCLWLGVRHEGLAESFARAAVIGLLRAKRAQKGESP